MAWMRFGGGIAWHGMAFLSPSLVASLAGLPAAPGFRSLPRLRDDTHRPQGCFCTAYSPVAAVRSSRCCPHRSFRCRAGPRPRPRPRLAGSAAGCDPHRIMHIQHPTPQAPTMAEG
ncbi:hypothetical protein V8E51_017180 [Hyaloscypha variabilis]